MTHYKNLNPAIKGRRISINNCKFCISSYVSVIVKMIILQHFVTSCLTSYQTGFCNGNLPWTTEYFEFCNQNLLSNCTCFPEYFTDNTVLYLNTGLSSSVNWNRKLLTEEADIVTAHGTCFLLFIAPCFFILCFIRISKLKFAKF